MSMRTNQLAVILLASLAGQAVGQSFNIDIGTSGSAPASSFGGAAGQAGTWNNISSSSAASVVLNGLNGAATSAQFLRDPSTTFATNSVAGITGSYESLLEDVQTNGSSSLVYKITGLQPGAYLFYTYATDVNASTDVFGVSVNNALGQSSQYSGGAVTSNTFRTGQTHSIHYRIVNIGDTVQINVGGVGGITSQCAGMQVVYLGNNGSVARWYVDDTAVSDHGGRSWAAAMTDLQDALDAAGRTGGNAEVWVASGTYKPTTTTDRNASFVIPNGLKLYGGFNGTETALSQRPMYPTVLSGAIGAATDTDNSYTVVDASGVNGSTVFDGFTVTRGYNNLSRGGGMLADNAYLSIRNVTFLSNFATSGGALAATGGYPKISRSTFNLNSASTTGGALRLENALASTIRLSNCKFFQNTSSTGGGAIWTSSLSLAIANSLFNGNSSSPASGGAVACTGNVNNNCTAFFSNCTFTNNTAGTTGGALYGQTKLSMVVWNSILWNNAALSAGTDKQAAVKAGDLSAFNWSRTTIQGLTGVYGWDPKFVDLNGADNVAGTFDDDLHLAGGSPAIDSGSNDLIAPDSFDLNSNNDTNEATPVDLDEKPRQMDVASIDDTPGEVGPVVDRGCYERALPTCVADLDQSGEVDLADFFIFFNAWDQTQELADVDFSGEIDLGDFFMFLNAFDAGC